jgi:hypothetical protein
MDVEQKLVSVPVVADHIVLVLLEVHFEVVEYSHRWEDCTVLREENVLEILGTIVVVAVVEGYVFVVGDNFFRLRKRVS